jgi:hypothetical protein
MLPTIDLDALEALLYRESSSIDAQDVAALMLEVCTLANAEGPEAAEWLATFRTELENQIFNPEED